MRLRRGLRRGLRPELVDSCTAYCQQQAPPTAEAVHLVREDHRPSCGPQQPRTAAGPKAPEHPAGCHVQDLAVQRYGRRLEERGPRDLPLAPGPGRQPPGARDLRGPQGHGHLKPAEDRRRAEDGHSHQEEEVEQVCEGPEPRGYQWGRTHARGVRGAAQEPRASSRPEAAGPGPLLRQLRGALARQPRREPHEALAVPQALLHRGACHPDLLRPLRRPCAAIARGLPQRRAPG
mmetsp:Transcript_9359/g.29235  ORF Transcript_9359/g.29235 Transcript_9359/m.29235 type:complete len:234 (+) Transcript_9359:657-1358(+)